MAKESSGGFKKRILSGANYVINNTPEPQGYSRNGSGTGKKKSGAGIILLAFIVILFLFFWPSSPLAKSIESGYLASTSIGRGIGLIGTGFGNVFKSVANSFSLIQRAAEGEEVFSFETQSAEIQKKTGLSFGGSGIFGEAELSPFGTYTNEEFGIRGDVIVGKLDDNIPMLGKVKLNCELKNGVAGRIEMDDSRDLGNGKVEFDIQNPKPAEEARIPFHCLFNSNGELDSTLNQKINKADAKLSLTYPFEVSSRLELFALPQETYNNYKGRFEAAFDELEGGLYKDRNSRILAKPKFISDVGLTLWFDNQPIGVGREFLLRYGFKNENTKNKFLIRRFEIELPNGIDFNPVRCKGFVLDRGRGRLVEGYNNINSALNDESRLNGQHFGSCAMIVNERILGGSDAEIVKAEDIIATLEYEYTIVAEKTIDKIKKPAEEKSEEATAENPQNEQTIS
ncbi:hypothetical protein HYT56_04605 [Candidatus Woesearchaeota archaeon]|nr:hypothetical protein [Candidatus Woesearchaeota archaeon]